MRPWLNPFYEQFQPTSQAIFQRALDQIERMKKYLLTTAGKHVLAVGLQTIS